MARGGRELRRELARPPGREQVARENAERAVDARSARDAAYQAGARELPRRDALRGRAAAGEGLPGARTEKYRYQKFCPDIAGQDPAAHGGDPVPPCAVARNWLSPHAAGAVPGGKRMVERYAAFRSDLPAMVEAAELDPPPLPFPDYTALVMAWLEASRPT